MEIVKTALSYRRGPEIGHGFFGTVYLADDPQLGGQVAVKEIPKIAFPAGAAEFFREAHAMFASESPNVVPIRYASDATDHVCLAMPYFKNGSLEAKIKDGPLPVADVIHIGQGLLDGLAQVHRVGGLIHYDVKPSNVLFSNHGDALIADFGQAKAIGTAGLAPLPTAMYHTGRPPEAFSIADGSIGYDVYQAGLTLYRAVNGNPHWLEQIPSPTECEKEITKGRFPDRRHFMPHVPRALRTVLRKALNVDPVRRFATAEAFSRALNNVTVRLRWRVTLLPHDEIQWEATRDGRSSLVVTLTRNRFDSWDVKHYTQTATGRRKRGESDLWQLSLGRISAWQGLDSLFAQLEQE
jgi:serine/threonine protein kinase